MNAKRKIGILSVFVVALVLLVSGLFSFPFFANTANTAYAEIPSSSTGFVPSRNTSEEIVYHLFKTQNYELTAGKEIMYVAGTDLANTMVVPTIPAGSATLRVTSSGKAYNTNDITCYVDVVERGNGFDGCPCGTLNNNALEYNCCYGGIQHYKGAPFNYSSKIYYNSARVGVFENNVAITNATVQLFDGTMYFALTAEGNGYYSSTTVFNGQYEIVVNGEHTGKPLIVDKFIIGEDGYLDGGIFYSGITYTENVYFYTMQVKTYLDGELSNAPGSVYLKSPLTNCALTRSEDGVYGIRYIATERTTRENYAVVIGGLDTGYVLSDSVSAGFKNDVSIYYYTLSVTINADTDWTDAKVELRNDNGEVRSILKYQSSVGTSALYTNIMQKDEAEVSERLNVFVDNVATDEAVYSVRSGERGSADDKTFASVTYYDVTVNLRLDNAPFTQPYSVSITNGVNSYALTNTNGLLSLRVRMITVNEEELPYKVIVSGVTDHLAPLTLTQENKTVTYDYYTVTFYTYTSNGTSFSATVYRTQYVRNGSVPSLVSDAYASGMTFDKWSLSTWTEGEDLDSITAYDFSNAITAPVNLYPHFAKTEVKINESFVKCGVNGTQNSNGVAFRMANVTVTGFEKGNDSIKSILLNLKNVETVYFYSTSGKTYKQGQDANLTAISGGFSATNSAISIVFNEKVSMAEAQDYIRNYIVIKPIVNQDVQVTLTVSDGVLSTSASTTIAQSQWGGTTWTVKGAGTYGSWWIGSNKGTQYVYFTGNCTFNGSSSGWGGLEIYGTCYLYIPAGVTVTCNGVAGSGSTPGGAGIYLASGCNLYVLGEGTLVANGGRAGNGSNGAGGGGGWKSGSYYQSGGGGTGGAGGGGAGAGIGTHGAYGGNGGGGGAAGGVNWSSKGKAQFWGQGGSAGGTGGTPAAAGNLYTDSTVKISAKGGAAGSNGSGGGAGGYQTDAGTGWKYNHCAAGGGGGGGGGAGYAANNIGAGGAGGGGGGGGGSGACDYHSSTSYNCIGGGKGGTGGYGASGQAGRGGNAHCDHQDVPGGNGGGAGSGGSGGASKSATQFTIGTGSNTKWSVTFSGAASNATQYYSFKSTTIVVPDYVPTGKNLFLGWKVSTYGYNPYGSSASRPLTTAESVLYQPGEKITTALGTYGNIVLTPITMPYSGKIAQDKLDVDKSYFATSNPVVPTYSTYAIQTYLDGEAANVGTMVFTINEKNYKVESSASAPGLYSLTLEANVETFTAKLNGESINATLNKGSNNVYFESLKVVVTGHNDIQSLLLMGAGAPMLQKDESVSSEFSNVFSAIKQQGIDTNTYTIVINGETISAGVAVAKFGTTAIVRYSTVDVDLKTNMSIEKVELIDADKNLIGMTFKNNVWTVVGVLDADTVYTVYADGFDTKVTVKFDQPHVTATAKIFEFKLVTRINGVVSPSISNLTVNGKSTTMKTAEQPATKLMAKSAPASNEYWSYVVVDDEAVTIEANGTQVTTVTPSEDLGNTYIDYYTVEYDAGEATGSVPVDDNLYLAGQNVTIQSYNHLSTGDEDTYLAGWSANGNNYSEGDVTTINGPLVLTAVLSKDLLKVHYVDYFGELEVKSQLDMADRLVAYDGDQAVATFNDYGRIYTLKGWVLDIDGTKTIYQSGELTDFVVGEILGDTTEEINVTFTAVYSIDYLNDIHFELGFNEADDPEGDGSISLGHVGQTFTVNYTVTVNDGVTTLLLIPQFDRNVFKIANVTMNDGTVLGTATPSENMNVDPYKIAFEGTALYNTTGDILISIEYEVINNIAGKYSDFGLVLDYPEDTMEDPDNNTRSNAWYILAEEGISAIHNEIRIYVDNEISVIIQTEGYITIEEQSVYYHGEALTTGHVYVLATEFDSEATYYEFVAGEFVESSDVTADNFGDNYYYVRNEIDDVLFAYSGYGQQVFCVTNQAEFTIKWYTYDELTDTYTEIPAPVNVGDYYVGISSTASDYVYSVEEVKQLIHILKAEITYTIHDKTSVWSEAIVSLTGEITDGTVYGDDELNIALSTEATSESNVGHYAITGTFDHGNYNVTFVNGDYEITKKQIELGLDATAKFNDNSFAYDGTEKTISAVIAEFYQDILSVSYSGGEDGCSGNGAINVLFNENNEVTGYTITALFTINEAYLQNCEFVKDGDDNDINTLTAVLTITINGITKAQFEELISTFVEFSVVDGETKHVLTPDEDNAMLYDKIYDAIAEYAKVVVSLEKNDVKNDKISPVVTYKLDGLESVVFNASLDFDYGDYTVKNANVYVVTITFVAGNGYAFEADVDPVFTITMIIEKKALTIHADAEVSYLDEAPVITIDEGTNAWVDGENYQTYGIDDIQHFAYLVQTSYAQGNHAGTGYTLTWTVPNVLSEVLYNYDLTFTTESGKTVQKRIINVDDYEFTGYSWLYDGYSHELQVFRGEDALMSYDALVSYTIRIDSVEKYSVKNVVDSGIYIATLTLKDPDNYIFSDSTSEIWELTDENTVASMAKDVVVAEAPLVVEVVYTTKSNAVFSVSGFVAEEDATVLTNFTFLLDSVAVGNHMTATASGTFALTAQSDNTNYQFTEYILEVYEVSFVSGPYEESVAGVGIVPQNMPESQFIFSGLDADTYDVEEITGMFYADLPAGVPTLRHYTFQLWSEESDSASAFDFAETVIDSNVVIYALWEENETYTITYKYTIDLDETWNILAVDTFYTDDQLVYGDTLRSLEGISWFIGNTWYLDDELQTRMLNKIYRTEDLVLYGNFRFDIGIGDVNASGGVDANDITLYREWIVGGYPMIVIEVGDEWSTVTGEAFDLNNVYFLKRVADSNAQTTSSVVLGDGALDIRDVSTIRMALVGGYGFDVATGVVTSHDSLVIVSVSEIDNVSKLLLAVGSGKKAKLSKDIDESVSIVEIDNLQKTIVIDLNGKTITVPSFSLALADNFDGKIEIYNGSIVTTNGISLRAPNGNVILNNVTLLDENGDITLAAASNSLHFFGDVELLRKDSNGNRVAADVTIPSTTHVVVESGSTLIVKNIVVEQVGTVTFSIELNNEQPEEIAIQGNYTVSGTNDEIISSSDSVTTYDELSNAAEKGFDIRLGGDIAYTGRVTFKKDATLDLNGYTLRSTNDVAISVVNGASLTINGNGNVIAQEACVMAFKGSSVEINGGTFTAIDNFVIGTHGSNGQGGNTITINAGTFNGGITSAGYVACGIYVANSDTVTVNGGTFNITNGVGILARSGNTTVGENVVFNVTGNGDCGKIGDSRVVVPAGEVLVLDLKAAYPGGVPTINNNSAEEVYVVVDGTYTFANSDATFHAARGVYDNVILTADLDDYLYVTKDMNLYLNGHTVDTSATSNVAIYVVGGAKLTINGNGNVIATEGCVMAFDGSAFVINGGTYTCYDNFVFGTNGSAGRGGNTITINGGTFNGSITSENYIACGIYVANSDTVVVNGGEFNITNGVGILARSGNTTVGENVVFNMLGENEIAGIIGDAEQPAVQSGNALVWDFVAGYPGGDPTLVNYSAYEAITLD